ncbi:store-operated calcium entry regulator STIMATE-like [Rhopilema esculentum]|uniref:store-operated calcium entry regulator STIMATE-like n=1 Tax=Rhopilema esculentum TaxID=499914 RepID=UPI0031DD9518
MELTNSSVSLERKNGQHFVFRCELNDGFGLVLQGILAFTAFCILILKRYREPASERRPVKVWFFDTSKQAIGAVIIHFANVFLASAFKGDPCTWYFINFLLDTTIGLVIIWLFLKMASIFGRFNGWRSFRFGEYGNPPQRSWWFRQCFVYIIVMLIEKSIIVLLVQLSFWDDVRKFILTPFKYHPKLEAGVVMLIVPFIMNALMFWVVDNFLMHRKLRKNVTLVNEDSNVVKFLARPRDTHASDDEVVLHSLMENESHDTIVNDDSDFLHRRDYSR